MGTKHYALDRHNLEAEGAHLEPCPSWPTNVRTHLVPLTRHTPCRIKHCKASKLVSVPKERTIKLWRAVLAGEPYDFAMGASFGTVKRRNKESPSNRVGRSMLVCVCMDGSRDQRMSSRGTCSMWVVADAARPIPPQVRSNIQGVRRFCHFPAT